MDLDLSAAHLGRLDIVTDLRRGGLYGVCPACVKAFFIWGLAFYESQPHEARVYEVMFPSFATIKEFSVLAFDFCTRERSPEEKAALDAQLRQRLTDCTLYLSAEATESAREEHREMAAHPDMVEATSIYLGSCLVHHWHLGRDWLGFRSAFSSNDTVNVGMREIFKDGAIQRVRYLVTWFDRVETRMLAWELVMVMLFWRPHNTLVAIAANNEAFFSNLSRQISLSVLQLDGGHLVASQAINMLVELAEKMNGQFSLAGTILSVAQRHLFFDALADLRRHSDASLAIRIDYVCDTFAAASGLASPNDPTYESLEIAKLSPYRELQQVVNRVIGTRVCSLTGCGRTSDMGDGLRRCTGCMTVAYCSVEHSMVNWRRHEGFCRGLKRLLDRLPGVELDKWAFQSPEVFAAGFKAAKPTMNEIAALVHCLHDGWRGKPGEENSSYCEAIMRHIQYLMIQEIASEVVEKMGDCKIVALRPENLAP
ncbi:hypothetical protein BKA62DRAFT_771441 [Auriculariales sp. MPI-PUGE-AT-0066]|nr:hypothetical protein BKA62DRAFT_771441 [Auriculariales sp. MPI-PUGE-AT-0066]